jgi:hypothetical protein
MAGVAAMGPHPLPPCLEANGKKAPAPRGFLPWLPQDEALGEDVAAEELLQLINEDLSYLLCSDDAEFWNCVKNDRSLQTCLDTYLQNCRLVHAAQQFQSSTLAHVPHTSE